MESISAKQHSVMEANAESLAGLILVPSIPLQAKLEEARAMGLGDGFSDGDLKVRSYMADWIARSFHVSAGVVDYRSCYDNH